MRALVLQSDLAGKGVKSNPCEELIPACIEVGLGSSESRGGVDYLRRSVVDSNIVRYDLSHVQEESKWDERSRLQMDIGVKKRNQRRRPRANQVLLRERKWARIANTIGYRPADEADEGSN